MMLYFNIANRYQPQNIEPLLRRAAAKTLELASARPDVELSLAVIGDAEIRELNKKFRGENQATDVLTFPAGNSNHEYLGDVVISFPTAKAQAKHAGHRIEDELQLLTIHGVLHLLGYDHIEPSDKEHMWGVQTAALNELGVQITTEHAENPHSS